VTRPQPLAAETADRLRSLGHDVLMSPLLELAVLPWEQPTGHVEAIAFTSPQAPGFAGPQGATYRALPVFAVGARTAEAARKAGFSDVHLTEGNASTLFEAVQQAGFRHVLHMAGRERAEAAPPEGLEVIVRVVYEARLADVFAPEAERGLREGHVDWVLLFSARTASHFASLYEALGLPRTNLSIAAISPAALAAAGTGWGRLKAASVPSEVGVLAAAGLSCDKPAETNEQELR